MQQRRICSPLIEGQEGDIGDASEPLQCTPDLSARVDSQRPGSQLIRDDSDAHGRADESTQFSVVTKEAGDRQRVGGGHGDDDVCLAQRGCGGGMAAWARQVIGDLFIGVERRGHVYDDIACPLPAECQRRPQPPRG